jgi:hypothetical protein
MGFRVRVKLHGRHFAAVLAVGSVLVHSGCVADKAADLRPPMPRVLPAPPAEPKPVVSRDDILRTATTAMQTGDLGAAARALESMPPVERRFIEEWSGRDPVRAANLALALSSYAWRMEALEIATRGLVARDAAAAVDWAIGRSDAAAKFEAQRAVADRLVERDAATALEQLQARPESPARDEMIALTAARWARRDADAALAWSRRLAPAALRNRVLTSVSFEIAQTAPQRALAAVELLPEGRERSLVLSAIGQTWIAMDSGAALAWAQGLPAGAMREAALAGIDAGLGIAVARNRRNGAVVATNRGGGRVGAQRTQDPRTLPAGVERDRALRDEFERLLQMSPVRAADWLTTLSSTERTDEMLRRLMREWLASNPTAARQWLELNVPSEAWREQLLRESGQ